MAKVALVDDAADGVVADIPPALKKTAEAPTPAGDRPAAEKPAAPPAGTTGASTSHMPPPAKKGGRRRVILLGVAVIAIAAGAYFGHSWWTVGRFMISTDDAYVGADTSVLAPRISGYVTKVDAVANSAVKAGDPLVYLDDTEQKLAIQAAQDQIASQEAAIARIGQQITAGQASVDQAKAAIASANAEAERTAADLVRTTQLTQSRFSSQQSLEQAKAADDKAKAGVDSAKAGVASAEAAVAVTEAQRVEAERALEQYRTALSQRQVDLDHTVIRAPFDGVVGNRSVDPGEFVAAGQRLLAIVPLSAVYIDANFKETQLDRIRPGATAKITVDAASDGEIDGTVESIAPASGSVFSLLPPDNATGNFTKITQRVPVRIKVPAEEAAKGYLRPGLSVTVDIDSRTGSGAAEH
ncbi:HlyD family secretion protein [Kaistia dalseonensis]|uniref:Membrane fusion protein (Multidrug efflux system) n=1 Tax=Kaistia dalseonensis TaxID=410840 RepID=A0ABU0H9A2_9HYPH|nr:HlyD family secretion protein [Kaistia dalseonensis]MCX5495452.1 HlyD family secretion protein [Kaistia dalseonensis]MDQ0438041.1 membrane fusion protein (multidrug efflux system) [Kaistia dalseonensis]